MSEACHNVLERFVSCLRESDCIKVCIIFFDISNVLREKHTAYTTSCTMLMQVHHKDVRTCAKEVEECSQFRLAYYNCKRGQVDARTRIPGNKHAS